MSRLLRAGVFVLLALLPDRTQAQSEPYIFDFQGQKLDVPASPWQVTQVLDLRADRSRLGQVHRGLGNQLVSASFVHSLSAELLQFIDIQLPPAPGRRPVLMRVLTLALSEDLRASSEHAEAELVADFLEPQPDSTFRVLLTVGELTRRGGLDVTRFHPANLALVLQQALRQLAALPPAAPHSEVLSSADVRAGRGGAAAQRFAIQQAPMPKRGLYRSFQEFRDNAPSEPAYAYLIEHIPHSGKRWAGTDEVQPYYLHTDAAHPRRNVPTANLWGLSDGKEMLVVYRSHFYKLLPAADGRHYTFLGPPVYDAQAAATVAGAAVVGGLVGAAIAGAATSGANTMDPYELHLASGRIVPVEEPGRADANGFATADTAKIYVYRRPESGKSQPLTLNASGQATTQLSPVQWTALSWQDRRRELEICVQSAAGAKSCLRFVPDFSRTTYLECAVPAGGGAPILREVPAKEGLFELRRIQRLAKTRN
jgi:hypothetical protein